MVVLEFPSMEQALKWYDSPEYAPLIKLRQKASKGKLIIVEGRLENERASRDALSASSSSVVFASCALDHRAGAARAGVAGRLRLVVVGLHVDDQAAADDAVRARRRR